MTRTKAIARPRAIAQQSVMFCAITLILFAFSACEGEKKGSDPDTNTDPEGKACAHHHECGVQEICKEGHCTASGSCRNIRSWSTCANRAERAIEGEGWMYVCQEETCERLCVYDSDCDGDDSICSDFGQCISYDGTLLPYDSGDNTPGPLRAGVAQRLIDVPIGSEMGGYGSRGKPNDGRYAFSLSASQGQMDAQFVRAVALDNGNNRLLLMRLPVVFSFSQLHERVARVLQEETGVDWRDELVISSTHTHSGPTGFWRFPEDTVIDVGMLGAGKFVQAIEDWFVESMASTALDAIANMKDAKLGWTIVENYDPQDEIARDRWRSTPPFDMRRLLVMRIDDAETDTPMAALMSYASHGTSNSKDYLTDDVIGGAEHGVSQALYQEYGTPIPTLYFSEAGGTMSPALGSFPYSRDVAAHRVSQRVVPAFNDIVPKRDIALRSRIYRFHVSHDRIGYDVGDFFSTMPESTGGPLYTGALMCGGKVAGDDDYTTHLDGRHLSCLGSVRMIVHNYQPTPLTRSQITALEIDGLHAVTLPGEPAQEIGWQVMREMRDRFELPTASNWIFGYVNDHLLYITPTNLRGDAPDVEGFVLGDGMDNPSNYTSLDDYPDFAFSYLQGGYETEMTPWGPKSGDFLVDRATDAVRWLLENTAPPEAHAPILPTQYTRIESPEFPQDATPDADIGTVLEDAPATVMRLQPFTFMWIGGDHGVEAPQSPLVRLERQTNDGAWVDAIGPDGLPIDNRGLAMATRLQVPDEEDGISHYQWSVYFQPQRDLPEGLYRLNVSGHYLSDTADARTPYSTQSAEFTVLSNDEGAAEIAYDAAANSFSVVPYYPALPELEQNTHDERARLSGALRLVDPRVGSVSTPAPMVTEEHALTANAFIDASSVRIVATFEEADADPIDASCDVLLFECRVETVGGQTPSARIVLELPADHTPLTLEVTAEDYDGNTSTDAWSAN